MQAIHITDSYKVPKKDFKKVLDKYRMMFPSSEVWKRSYNSLYREWAVHNACYALGLWRSQTKDVDLNYPLTWYEKLGYSVFGVIVWPFIK